MIKVECIEVWGFPHAIRGARNPMNSWDKSDSGLADVAHRDTYDFPNSEFAIQVFTQPHKYEFQIGSADMDLMRRLYKAGTEHRKYLRQIFVSMDITAPLYWISELDTYKIGTTRNSCSFMHKGVSKPFEITDFSIHDERVYEVLLPTKKKHYALRYPYETDEYKPYIGKNGREYKIFKNGRVVACRFEYTDTYGRHRVFDEAECKPSLNNGGYYELNIGGRNGTRWLLHRLVASVWIDNSDDLRTVNHIDGDKGNNCVENLEWCGLTDNIKKGFEAGLFDNGKSLRASYLKWKNNLRLLEPVERTQLMFDYKHRGKNMRELADEYGITVQQVNGIIWDSKKGYDELFALCYTWEKTIEELNEMRSEYLETKDPDLFQQIRCLLPCGYNQKFTITMNYENVMTIINQRSGHKLDEWNDLIAELRKLPYVNEIRGEEK